jgi:hypothetical protein
VLLRIFGLKTEEVTGRWRNLYDEEPHNLHVYSLTDVQIKEDGVHVACSTHGKEKRRARNFSWKT